MKETKVYLDELPKSCVGCDFAFDGKCQALERKQYYCIENCRRSDCPLHSIKDYKRELIKEVCEKLKEKAFGLWYFVLNEQKEHFEGNRYVLSQKDFNDILDQIQKEFENGKYR